MTESSQRLSNGGFQKKSDKGKLCSGTVKTKFWFLQFIYNPINMGHSHHYQKD